MSIDKKDEIIMIMPHDSSMVGAIMILDREYVSGKMENFRKIGACRAADYTGAK